MWLFTCLFVITQAQQTFTKQWDKRFGGIKNDMLQSFIQVSTGGYLAGGYSNSPLLGDKTQNSHNSSDDYWIVRIDDAGNKLWDKSFGGNNPDVLYRMLETEDKGFLLGGYSSGGISGDKTQPSQGAEDFWIVRIDSVGNKLWDKRYGGTGIEYLFALEYCEDKGFIMGGFSSSGISGDKTQANHDPGGFYYDYWIIKVDSLGNKQWDKSYGGNEDDFLRLIIKTRDHGYLLGGATNSDSTGDMTQKSRGYRDFWIVKVDSTGNKQWDKRYGGDDEEDLFSAKELSDGYILAGSSGSFMSGDKTNNFGGYWFVRVDTAGNILWDKSCADLTGAQLKEISLTGDNGFLLSGVSASPVYEDKSGDSQGQDQLWVVKVDSLGTKEWDKTIFTYSTAEGLALPLSEHCYIAATSTTAGISGYKSEPNWDASLNTFDYWFIKFCIEPVGLTNVTDDIQIAVYPNPFSTEVLITIQKENLQQAQFVISNSIGQIVYKQSESNLSSTYTKMLDLSWLPNGLYLLEAIIDGEKVVRQLVKE